MQIVNLFIYLFIHSLFCSCLSQHITHWKEINEIITVMYSREKNDATQRKTLKYAGYRSKKKGSSVDVWSHIP